MRVHGKTCIRKHWITGLKLVLDYWLYDVCDLVMSYVLVMLATVLGFDVVDGLMY